MSINVSAMQFSTWTAGNIVVATGPVAFYGIVGLGSAAAGTVTLVNSASTAGTAICAALSLAITSSNALIFSIPIALSTGLCAINTGTGSYTVYYGLY